jgi:hypothetical protein
MAIAPITTAAAMTPAPIGGKATKQATAAMAIIATMIFRTIVLLVVLLFSTCIFWIRPI